MPTGIKEEVEARFHAHFTEHPHEWVHGFALNAVADGQREETQIDMAMNAAEYAVSVLLKRGEFPKVLGFDGIYGESPEAVFEIQIETFTSRLWIVLDAEDGDIRIEPLIGCDESKSTSLRDSYIFGAPPPAITIRG